MSVPRHAVSCPSSAWKSCSTGLRVAVPYRWKARLCPRGGNARWPFPPSRSILLEAAAFRVGARVQRHGIAVGPLAPRGLHAPEIRQARLVVRVLLEVLTVDQHRLA